MVRIGGQQKAESQLLFQGVWYDVADAFVFDF
jgi:hypothetical protein